MNTTGGYTKSNIDLYYVINGEARLYNEPLEPGDKGFVLLETASGKPYLRITPNTNADEKYPLTLLKFGNSKRDTIKVDLNTKKASQTLVKIWFNGIEKDRTFTVNK